MKEYDIIIVGGGPAGLTAGLYTSRARLSTLLIERTMFGGQIANVMQVENYPGFPEGVDGFDLGQLMHQQATRFGLEVIIAEATGIELEEDRKVVRTTEGDFTAKVVIIATGTMRRKLSIPGEEAFAGRGVSYCATCDAAFFAGKPVAVVGGDNTAITEALHLAKIASRVTIIHRRNQLHATRILQEKVSAEPNIEVIPGTAVDEIVGEPVKVTQEDTVNETTDQETVSKLRLRDVASGEKSELEVTGVFISIGLTPNTEFTKALLDLDESGHIHTNERMETKIPGIYATGDVRYDSARQAITAAGDGATAAIYAEKFVSEK